MPICLAVAILNSMDGLFSDAEIMMAIGIVLRQAPKDIPKGVYINIANYLYEKENTK